MQIGKEIMVELEDGVLHLDFPKVEKHMGTGTSFRERLTSTTSMVLC